METLYADHYLKEGKTDEARPHLKKMDEYFSPTSYVPCRGLYYNVYSHYYRMTQEYDKAIAYSDTAVNLLAEVSDNEGLSYKIERAGIFTDAGRADESIALLRSLLAKRIHCIGNCPFRRPMKSIRCAICTACFSRKNSTKP